MQPQTRKETFLAAIGGEDVQVPKPVSREEKFYAQILKSARQAINLAHVLNDETKNASILLFQKKLMDDSLSLSDYGKLRAAVYINWSRTPELTAAEITDIFGEGDPAEMETAEIDAAVCQYAGITADEWESIQGADAHYNITSKYLPDRPSITTWLQAHFPEEAEEEAP